MAHNEILLSVTIIINYHGIEMLSYVSFSSNYFLLFFTYVIFKGEGLPISELWSTFFRTARNGVFVPEITRRDVLVRVGSTQTCIIIITVDSTGQTTI